MKKIIVFIVICSVLSVSMVYPPVYDVSATSSELLISENFDEYEQGSYTGSKMIDENRKLSVIGDKNRLGCITVVSDSNASKGSVFSTKPISLSRKTIFSFKIRNSDSTSGNSIVSLRENDDLSPNEYSNLIVFLSIKSGEVTYLPQMGGPTEEMKDTDTASIAVVLEPNSGEICIYRDGILKYRVDDYTTLHGGSWSGFNMGDCIYRFQTIAKGFSTAKVYLDDILCCFDMSLISNVFVSANLLCSASEEENGERNLYPINSIRDGRLQSMVMIVNESFAEQRISMIIACKKDGALCDVVVSENCRIRPYEFTNVNTIIDIDDSTLYDSLEVFLLDYYGNLTPVMHKSVYTKSALDKPIVNELEYLYKRNAENVHPRIMALTEDFDSVKSNSNLSDWRASVIGEADVIEAAELNSETEYNIEYCAEGGMFLNVAQRVRKFMEKLGMAYQLTNAQKYPDKAYEIMDVIGNYQDWIPNGQFLATAEMTAAFAIGYDWMYYGFTDAQRAKLEGYIRDKGVYTGKAAYDGTGGTSNSGWWKTVNHNWNVVCNSGMIMGALAIADAEPELSFYVIEKALNSLNYALLEFAPDGAWAEGYDYIEFIFQTLSRADSSLIKCLGKDFGITSYPGMATAGDFMIHTVGETYANNFHDAGLVTVDTPELMWFAKRYNKPEYAQARLRSISKNNFTPSVYDLLYYDDAFFAAENQLALDAYFRDTEYVSTRSGWGEGEIWLSYHGGKNNENHSHVDSGAFVFEALGERWACDLGADNYAASGYFSDDGTRYKYYRTRAEGHNTLVIDPDMSAGQELDSDTKVIAHSLNVTEPNSTIDLTSAYRSKADSVTRKFELTNNRTQARITDTIILKSADSTVYWFMHTKADTQINIVSPTVAELSRNGKKLRLELVSDAPVTVLTEEPAQPFEEMGVTQNVNNSNYKKLQIRMSGSKDITLSVKLIPVQ